MKLLLDATFKEFFPLQKTIFNPILTSGSAKPPLSHNFWTLQYVRLMLLFLILSFVVQERTWCFGENHLLKYLSDFVFFGVCELPSATFIKSSKIERDERLDQVRCIFGQRSDIMIKIRVNFAWRLCDRHEEPEEISLGKGPLTSREGQEMSYCSYKFIILFTKMLREISHVWEDVKNMRTLKKFRWRFRGGLKVSEEMHKLVFLWVVEDDLLFRLLHRYKYKCTNWKDYWQIIYHSNK